MLRGTERERERESIPNSDSPFLVQPSLVSDHEIGHEASEIVTMAVELILLLEDGADWKLEKRTGKGHPSRRYF